MPRRVTIQTASRLHFGLLQTGHPFGGCGVMVRDPANRIVVSDSGAWNCESSVADRAEPIVNRFAQLNGRSRRSSFRIQMEQSAPAHSGLGSGTQHSLGIAEGIALLSDLDFEYSKLATELAGRGKRSAVGIYGYRLGGLLYESAKPDGPPSQLLNSLVERVELPEQWRVLIWIPRQDEPKISGQAEVDSFSQLPPVDSDQLLKLIRCLSDQLMPAARARQFSEFTAAVSTYNQLSGTLFAGVQGGVYNGRVVTQLIDELNRLGVVGLGQSSWGPGVFGWADCEDKANQTVQLCRTHSLPIPIVTTVANQGRRLVVEEC